MNDPDPSAALGLIYDAAISPGRWADMLRWMAPAFNCHHGGIKFTSADRESSRAVVIGMNSTEHRDVLARDNKTNPIGLRMSAAVSDELIQSSEVIPRRDLEQSDMYQQVLRRQDIGHVGCLNIWHGRSGHVTISLSRPWRTGDFGAPERRLARAIAPHLRRAAHVARRLHQANLLGAAAQASIESVPHAVIAQCPNHRPGGRPAFRFRRPARHPPRGRVPFTQT